MTIIEHCRRWIGPVLGITAVVVGLIELNAIRKSSELAAAQAVMNAYYPARNAVIQGALRNLHVGKDQVLFDAQIEKYVPKGSEGDAVRKTANELMVNIETLGNLAHDQTLKDYAKIVEYICQQQAEGLLGQMAKSFVNDIVVKDAERQNNSEGLPRIELEGCQ